MMSKHFDTYTMGQICKKSREKSKVTLENFSRITGYKYEDIERFEQGINDDMILFIFYCEFFLDGNLKKLRSCIK